MDGFVLMCAALAPALMLGSFLTTRRKYVGMGMSYCIFFCFLAGPDNLVHYDPTGFMNDAIALMLSMIVARLDPPREERHRLQRIVSHLHFIRTALLDPESPFASFASSTSPAPFASNQSGASHAA